MGANAAYAACRGNLTSQQSPGERLVPARRVPALDGVRGIAIAIVVIHNAGFVLRESDAFLPKLASAITASGWIGVQLFFVLSGFLITGILADALGIPGFFRRFYARRTLRIFPLYYVFLIVAILAVPLVVNVPAWAATARANQWWFWAYVSNWGIPFGHDIPSLSHFWSLAVEEQFYLIWPLLVFFLHRRGLISFCAAIIVTAPLVRLLLPAAGLPQLAAYEFTIARWDALAFGAVLAILLRDESSRRWLRRRAGQLAGGALSALALLVAIEHGFHEDDVSVQVMGQTLIAALSAWLIYRCATPGPTSRLNETLSAPWMRFLGKYSYAIYVLHYPIHRIASYYFADAVNGADTNWRLLRLAAYTTGIAAVSIISAMVSWHVIEKPFLDLRDRLAPRSNPVPATQ